MRDVLGAESSEKLVLRFPRGVWSAWTPKGEEVTLGVGRPRNPEGEERRMRALGTEALRSLQEAGITALFI